MIQEFSAMTDPEPTSEFVPMELQDMSCCQPCYSNTDQSALSTRPIYVSGMPLGLRAYNGVYNPLFMGGKFSNMWRNERKSYWGVPIRPLLIKYDNVTKKWVFDRYMQPNQWQILFESAKDEVQPHPVFATWPDGICVSHHKPWFWQML